MKPFLLVVCIMAYCCLYSQQAKNVFIITIDGLRWQEVFQGADTVLLRDPKFVNDTELLTALYDGDNQDLRRQKLMPFFWNIIARKGQLAGNRQTGSKVNVSNFYKISYPGYNEILTGYSDLKPILNTPTQNRNISVLEYLNTEKEFAGKVVAFSSWNIFPFILNENRSEIPVNSGYENVDEEDTTAQYINQVQESIIGKNHCRYDELTYLAAKNYIQSNHPRVALIGLGETDEFAHQKKYGQYLQKINAIDKMIGDLWYYVQSDSFYRNQTVFIITTDHGRGSRRSSWYAHNLFVKGSGEVWQAMIGPGIEALGEIKAEQQVYQKQVAGTIAALLGKRFGKNKPIVNTQSEADTSLSYFMFPPGTVGINSAGK